ncbi:MAG TPA: helix-turn-helix transcriptional regulator [Pyrinomonadaceae bacterium]|nr:helix-turn-helix transcriptional regulator [Pyrinomonadaceae bacterium]
MTETFGQRVARWREAAGLNQDELARRVGVTGTYIGYLELEVDPTGIGDGVRPVVEVVDAIAEALDVPLAEARCAAGLKPPEDAPAACEVVRGAFGEADFVALQRMYGELTADNRRKFYPILRMVSRELELTLKSQ